MFFRFIVVLAIALLSSIGSCQCAVNKYNEVGADAMPSPIDYGEWKPGTLNGMIVGKSTRDEFRKVFGKAIDTTRPKNDLPDGAEAEIVDEYTYYDPYEKLQASFSPSTNILTGIVLVPKVLNFDDIKAEYGRNYLVTKYRLIECPGDAGASMIKEDAEGTVIYYEFRQLGMIVSKSNIDDSVNFVEFVAGALDDGRVECGKKKSDIPGLSSK